MKMIMAALAATALLAAAAAPASAQSDMEQIAEVLAKRAGDAEGLKLVKERRFVPRQARGRHRQACLRQQRVVAAGRSRPARPAQVAGGA